MKICKIIIFFLLLFSLNLQCPAKSNKFRLKNMFNHKYRQTVKIKNNLEFLMSAANLSSLKIINVSEQDKDKKLVNRYLLFQRLSWVCYGIMIAGDVALLTGVIILFFVPYQYLGGAIPFFSLTLSLIIGGSVLSIAGLVLALVFGYNTKLTFSKPVIIPTNSNENVIENKILDFKILL